MLPMNILKRTISLLEDIEPSVYHEARFEYFEILWVLQIKIQKLKLQKAYDKIIAAGEFRFDHELCVKCLPCASRIEHDDDYDVNSELPF